VRVGTHPHHDSDEPTINASNINHTAVTATVPTVNTPSSGLS
jgi:hypothetical protein